MDIVGSGAFGLALGWLCFVTTAATRARFSWRSTAFTFAAFGSSTALVYAVVGVRGSIASFAGFLFAMVAALVAARTMRIPQR